MNSKNWLPPIPKPPHDPTWQLLNAQVGWQAAELTNIDELTPQQTLALSLLPGSGRLLTEPSGSFGGLTLPGNVALGPDDHLYLLDRSILQLKRFDPCCCRFEPVTCFGGAGSGPRQLHSPQGIGINRGNLFVCDTGNQRLLVLSVYGWALRAIRTPPPTAPLNNAWEPYAVAFDSQGRVFVTDGANGCIHRFSRTGHWETCLAGFGVVTHLAIDCRDHLYVVIEGQPDSVRIINAQGEDIGAAGRPAGVAAHFSTLAFPVDAAGNLHLESFCALTHPSDCNNRRDRDRPRGIFDQQGQPVTGMPAQNQPLYYSDGLYLSQPLDSKLYRCQWHRIVVRGQVPAGTRIRVSTYTAEVLQPLNHVLALPEQVWQTRQTMPPTADGEWDCLVQSGAGRYLWLRLEMHSNGTMTPRIKNIQVEFPRISLRRYLPAVFGEDPSEADFTDRFLSLFDTTLRSVEQTIDHQARFFDPLATPAESDPKTGLDFLSWLAAWIGLSLDRHQSEAKRRQFLKQAARLYHLRGTRIGLHRQLLLYLGLEPETNCCPDDRPKMLCQPKPANCAPEITEPCAWSPPSLILEHYQLRRWLFLGRGRLGDEAMVWGQRIVNRSQLNASAQVGRSQLITTQDPYRDPFHVYAHKFTLFVPARYGRSAPRRKGLERLLRTERPAQTQFFVEYVEPRFRVGVQAMIGFDTVIGCYPVTDIALGETPLDQTSVLGAAAGRDSGPSLQIGRQARLGATTKLN